MSSSDLEDDIRNLVASNRRDEGMQRQLSCRVSMVCHHKIGVLAEKVNMTRTALAERLLEKATTIAWRAAGLAELSESEIPSIKTPTQGQAIEKTVNDNEMKKKFSRINCIEIVFQHLGLDVGKAKDSAAIASSADGSIRICCLTSKDYEAEKETPEGEHFWFTIYERQMETIQRVKQSYVAFGCGSLDQIVVVPSNEFSTWCKDLPPYTQGQVGWHVHMRKISGKLELRREGRGEPSIDVSSFVI